MSSPHKHKREIFHEAFRASLPVLFGYLPLGAACGVLFQTLGYHWIFAALMALFVYAGAVQFLSVSLIASSLPIPEIFLMALILNLRHIFYGFSFLDRYRTLGLSKLYLIHTLTDETYSVLTAKRLSPPAVDRRYCFYVSALDHVYWVIGCAIGGLLGTWLKIDPRGFEFVLVALFVVLAIEQIKTVRESFPVIVALISAALAFWISKSQFLILGLGFSFVAFLIFGLRSKRKVTL